jgi:hypothetical protein
VTLGDRRFDEHDERPRRAADSSRPPADREVPLERAGPAMGERVHAWLDGEATESSARRGTGMADVELWKRLDADFARRRLVSAPEGLEARIMAALAAAGPSAAPHGGTATRRSLQAQRAGAWWHRELVVTPANGMLVVLTVTALAVAATVLVLR